MKLIVEGMTCSHCVQAITAAIGRLDASARVEVDLQADAVRIMGDVAPEQAAMAIQDEGYAVVAILDDAAASTSEAGVPAKTCCGTCHT